MLKKFNQKVSEGILFTDQYQLVMSQLFFKNNLHNKIVQFDHFFRSYPDYGSHKAGYCINAGLEWMIVWMFNSKFSDSDLEALRNQKNEDGSRIFHDDYLHWLEKEWSYDSVNIKSIPEGKVIHSNEPITVVQGPVGIIQILETAILNQINYQILVATKAARIKDISRGGMLIDFGARRAQDRGANAGVRGALIGGADYSSNVGISHILGYAPKGTHAHSMVQLFLALGMSEEDSFQAFADLYPSSTILLVDTINTLESGIPNAIKVFEKLRKKGYKPAGIRLDSGDLAYLAIQSAKMLDEAGFNEASIVLSNELDEMNIWQIISQISDEASKHGMDADSIIKRLVYGVGTRLITSQGDAALGGVYKLVAVKENGDWLPAIKVSENIEKIPNPGNKQVYRIYDTQNKATADLLALAEENIGEKDELILHHPNDQTKHRKVSKNNCSKIEPLLEQIVKDGKIVYDFPSIEQMRETRIKDMGALDSGVKRLINPHYYHVSLTGKLWHMKQDLLENLKK